MSVDLGRSHVVLDGQFVNNKVANIATALAEYEPELCIDHFPEADGINQGRYAIVHDSPSMGRYVLFYVMKEEDMDERVIARVIHGDQRNSQVTYSELEAFEMAQQALKKQEFLDKMEEAADISKHLLRTHKNTYKYRDPQTGKLITHKE